MVTYHLWTYSADRRSMNITMNGDDAPRTWKDHQGPWGWAKKYLEYGTYKTSRCDCLTPCVYEKHRYPN